MVFMTQSCDFFFFFTVSQARPPPNQKKGEVVNMILNLTFKSK